MRTRPVLRWVLKLRSSPRAIAGGLGVGMFVAFTPTVGIQLILVVILATMLNVNRAASLIPVWITNPITIAPIYTFNYWLGLKFLSGPPLSEVSGLFIDIGRTMARLEFWNIKEQFMAVVQMSREILLPLLLGSIVLGTILGLLVYLVSLKLLSIFFTRRAQKHLLNHRRTRTSTRHQKKNHRE
ncbi:DUF2062 domain-containing protein [Desulforhopalus singaporensis]|uniref:DUF2062 domain-containing protein n=1 Tax=Desulforhopalus singaporensis TaxID=91360 RepID=A0A1H0QX21_9BACT|nr:DUF2062 domain-containing protein [Desulforhopalus singaporensis]SDP21278.1 hypothetical protein SAMN05660330_02092 [Desulforhopalus singaporensis]